MKKKKNNYGSNNLNGISSCINMKFILEQVTNGKKPHHSQYYIQANLIFQTKEP